MRKRLQIFCLLLLPCLTLAGLLGRGSPAALTAGSTRPSPPPPTTGACPFPEEGLTPVGNATADFLSQYDAWYVGDTSQKVIYLTFDCGYENGNTEAILDALKKHNAPAAFFVVGHMVESAPDIVRRMAGRGTHRGQPHLPPPGYVRHCRQGQPSRRSWIPWPRCIRRPPGRRCPGSTVRPRENTARKI